MSVSESAPMPSGGVEVPDFLKLKQIPANYLQEVETEEMAPVVFNEGSGSTVDGFVRFQLQNKGFLHSHSKVFISLIPNANASRGFFPLGVGVANVVKKAVLKVGNKILNEVNDWSYLHQAKSMLLTNEMMRNREQYLTGRMVNHRLQYNAGQDNVAPAYVLDNGREPDNINYQAMPFAVMEGNDASGNNFADQSPSFAIDLSDLFPFLKVNQLPLFMMNEPVSIELTLKPPQRRVVNTGGVSPVDLDYNIDRQELYFCADYIYYDPASGVMEQYQEQNQNKSFAFTDYRNVTTTITQGGMASGIVRNIGMANRMVNRVITMFNDDASTMANLFGQLRMKGMEIGTGVNAGKVGAIKYNLRYNDQYEFSQDITNPARLFSLTQRSEGIVFRTRGEYQGGDEIISTAESFEGLNQGTQLEGTSFMIGTQLTGGRVGVRGIELHLTVEIDANTDTMRNYCEYMRTATLLNGNMSITNA